MVSFDQAMQLRLFGPKMDSFFQPTSVKPSKQEIWNSLAAPQIKRPAPLSSTTPSSRGAHPRTSAGGGRARSPTRIGGGFSNHSPGGFGGPRSSTPGVVATGGGSTQGRKAAIRDGWGISETRGPHLNESGLSQRRGLLTTIEYSPPVDLYQGSGGLKASNREVWQSFHERVRVVDEWKQLHGFAGLPEPKKKKKTVKKLTRVRNERSMEGSSSGGGVGQRPRTSHGEYGMQQRRGKDDPYSVISDGHKMSHTAPHGVLTQTTSKPDSWLVLEDGDRGAERVQNSPFFGPKERLMERRLAQRLSEKGRFSPRPALRLQPVIFVVVIIVIAGFFRCCFSSRR